MLCWLETVRRNILIISQNELFALFLLCHEISDAINYKIRLKALYWLEKLSKNAILLSVKISCLRSFCCAVSVSDFFSVVDREFRFFGLCLTNLGLFWDAL